MNHKKANSWRVLLLVCWAWQHLLTKGAEEPLISSPIEGTWSWEFMMPDSTIVHPTLRIELNDEGQLEATTRFRPGTSTAITNLMAHGTQLQFTVVREFSGKLQRTEYQGTVVGESLQGTIRTDWSGSMKEYPWSAKRNVNVEGRWKWTFRPLRGRASRLSAEEDSDFESIGLKMALDLKRNGEKISGKLKMGNNPELEIKGGRFRDGNVNFRVERERDGEPATNLFMGRLVADRIVGAMISQANGRSRTNQWRAIRSE